MCAGGRQRIAAESNDADADVESELKPPSSPGIRSWGSPVENTNETL